MFVFLLFPSFYILNEQPIVTRYIAEAAGYIHISIRAMTSELGLISYGSSPPKNVTKSGKSPNVEGGFSAENQQAHNSN